MRNLIWRTLLGIALFSSANSVWAVALEFTWNGPATGDQHFSVQGNWSPPGHQHPADTINFTSANVNNAVCDGGFSSNNTVDQVNIQAGYTGTISIDPNTQLQTLKAFTMGGGTVIVGNTSSFFAGTLALNGGTLNLGDATYVQLTNFTQSGGTFIAPNVNLLRLFGNWTHSGGVFNPHSGAVFFQNGVGGPPHTIDGGGAAAPFNNVFVNSGVTTMLVNSDTAIDGTFGMNQLPQPIGTIVGSTFSANGRTLTVKGLATITNGTFVPANGTVNFNGGLVLGGDTATAPAPAAVNGTLMTESGTVNVTDFLMPAYPNITTGKGILNLGAGAFNISGNWTRETGTFPGTFNAPDGTTVTFVKPSGTQLLDTGGAGGEFSNFSHTGAGTVLLLNHDLVVKGAFTQSAGTFDANNRNVTITGALMVSQTSGAAASTFDASTGICTLNGGMIFNGGTVKSSGVLNSKGDIVAASGQSAIDGHLTLNPNSQVVFVQDAAQLTINAQTIGAGGGPLPGLHKEGPGTLILNSATTNHSSPTWCDGGTLQVQGNYSASNFFILWGGILTGSGTVGPLNTMGPGGGLPGITTIKVGPGTLTVQGDMNLNDGVIFSVNVSGTAGVVNEHLTLNGLGTINGATLQLTAPVNTPVGTKYTLIENDGADAIVGTFAGLPEGATVPNRAGSGASYVISYVGGTGNDVVVTAINNPPVITSAATAVPSTAGVGQAVAFSVAAGDLNGDALTYSWTFGDGTNGTGASTTHSYAAAGTYPATVTVSDGTLTATSMVSVTVIAPLVGGGNDADGDGFSDDFETTAGTSPNDIADTPTGKTAASSAQQQVTITGLSIKLNFAKPGADSIKVSGTIPIPDGFQIRSAPRLLLPAVQKVREAAARVSASFELNDKLTAKNGANTFKIAIKAKKGVIPAQNAKFSSTLSKGSFADGLKEAGLTGDTEVKKQQRTVLYTLIFNNTIFQKAVLMSYSAKPGKTGAATSVR